MQINLMGLIFETPCVVVHLYSPWRASALENKLFENIRQIPGLVLEQSQDELIISIRDLKTWKIALDACVRSLKGWQEDADLGLERRFWYWHVEGDVDADGYDHTGESASLWVLISAVLERAEIGPDISKIEPIEFEHFCIQIQGERPGK
jgi:hypothetical protein